MSKILNLLLLLFFLLGLFGLKLFARGNESSGGIDHHDYGDGTAWFLGQKNPIRTCAVIASDFKIDPAHARFLIEAASSTWTNYLKKKHILVHLDIASKVELIASACKGDEDLTVYFGGTSPEIESGKSHYSNPVALAERLQYDRVKGWGKGFIWIRSSQWRESDIRGILLHEFGHALGCSHLSNTVMDENVDRVILNADGPKASYFSTHIDYSRELVSCSDCTTESRSDSRSGDYWFDLTKSFTELSGRPPVGQVSFNFKKLPAEPKQAWLVLTDSLEEKRILINGIHVVASRFDSARMFQVMGGGKRFGGGMMPYSETSLGTLISVQGKRILVVINLNIDSGAGGVPPLTIRRATAGILDAYLYAGRLDF